MPIHASTYSGGMDRDSSKNKYQPNSYYKMKNMRLTSFEELSNGAVQSIEGNTLKISCPLGYTNDIIIGHCIIRNFLILFSTDVTDTIGGRGSIWKIDLSVASPAWTDFNNPIYQSDDLMFTTQHPIYDETIGYYEDDNTIKVYWTDNFNMIRYYNIEGASPMDCSLLDILPNVTLVQPRIVNISAGNLLVGKIQYSYQYYNVGGVETTFAPCSPLVHITKSSESLTGTSIVTYEGADALDDAGNPNVAGKSVTIQLNGLDTRYQKIRVVAIHYRNLDQEPDIHIVGEYDVYDGIKITDVGTYTKGTLTLNAFRTLGNPQLYCKTIEQKGNKAVIGNITEKFFDIDTDDFDTRVYRFAPIGGTVTQPYTLNITDLADLNLALCTNTKLRFDPITPPAIAALTNDTMAAIATVTHLRAVYTEDVPAALPTTITSVGSRHDTHGVTFESYTHQDRIFITIPDITTEITLPAGREILNITGVATTRTDTNAVHGFWHEFDHTAHEYQSIGNNTVFTIFNFDPITGTLELIARSTSGNYYDFATFHHMDTFADGGQTCDIYDMVYTYTYTDETDLVYETTTSTDVTYTRQAPLPNPANWLFDIDVNIDTYWTLINPFDANKIKSIHLDLDTSYTYTSASSAHIKVYNTVTGTRDTVITNAADGNPAHAWPNSLYQIDIIGEGIFNVPEDHDCINPYNFDYEYTVAGVLSPRIDEQATYADPTDLVTLNTDTGKPLVYNQFKWQSNLTTLGGEGPNIKYEFITSDMVIHETTDTRYNRPNIVSIQDLTSYDSYKNPLREAYMMSYKRDEVYRHGLVAVNKRGQESFVKWIGDIKIPTIAELPLTNSTPALFFKVTAVNTPFTSGPTITTTPGSDLSGTIEVIVKPSGTVSAVTKIRLTGTNGTANVMCNGITRLLTFNTDLATTANDFVTSNAFDYLIGGITLTAAADRYSEAHPIGIKFTINTTPLVALDVVGIKIVRVERKETDRTIYSQGILSNMFLVHNVGNYNEYDYSFVGYPRATIKTPQDGVDAARYTREPSLVQFISPEVNYFNSLSPLASDYIKIQSVLTDRYSYLTYHYNASYAIDVIGYAERTTPIFTRSLAADYNTEQWYNYNRYHTTEWPTISPNPRIYNIIEGVIAGPFSSGLESGNKIAFSQSPGGRTIYNRSADIRDSEDDLDHFGPSGTCGILLLDSDIDDNPLIPYTDDLTLYLVDYKHAGAGLSQYGGLTYQNRQGNTYIECGPYFDISIGGWLDADVYGGDTYISFFEHLRTAWEAEDNDGNNYYDIKAENRIFAMLAFPCESHINLDLVHGDTYSQWVSYDYAYGIREKKGTYDVDYTTDSGEPGIPGTPIPDTRMYLIQEEDMYKYNSVFSQQNTSKVYFPKPTNWLDTYVDDTLIKISLEKYPREELDSFMKFLTDNEKILPSEYGAINKLFLFRNYMIVFMEHAIGTISIDERALLPIQNNSILELGAGENLKNFEYISNKSGTVHPQSVSNCGNGFIWYDAHSGSMGYYNGETQDIGLVKGMSSPLKSFSDKIRKTSGGYYCNQLNGGSVMSYENQTYKETMCAFVVSGMASFTSNTGTIITLATTNSPGSFSYANVIINGTECIARTVSSTQIILYKADNPSVSFALASWPVADKYVIYYKDLSSVYSFSNIINAFMYEVDMYPTWMFEYNNKLYDVFGKFSIYQENNGNYGRFYNVYRNGELEYVINPKQSLVCLFNNYEYSMEAYDQYGANTTNETWDYIRIKNDYQYSASSGYDSIFTGGTGYIRRNSGAAHELSTGDEVMFSGASLPAELSNDVIYYAIRIDGTNFMVTTSLSVAPITFAVGGTGNYHTIEIPVSSIVTPVNDKRRFRTWRIKDLRDMRGYVAGVFKPRIRDTHIRLKFKYLHGDNKRILMHDLYTYYSLPRETIANQK